ncbi:MAG: hypothetical protein KZQ88_02935 [Candidatus Thiodiazotropha sp. (ex Dulcina madagascariensis)]|nr:hypothetical protein [Candidatus Thiodiazotropha sp. (ex Dulcina madagascariensis)]MCU7925596.1 hypothetical protein [Candidatus Thiodiazotropha sp. (ex Dulcina madagascariensis)]
MNEQDGYLQAFRGSFTSTLRWRQLDDLWQTVNTVDPGLDNPDFPRGIG